MWEELVEFWQPFWISIVIYCLLLIFIDAHYVELLLLALTKVCTLLCASSIG